MGLYMRFVPRLCFLCLVGSLFFSWSAPNAQNLETNFTSEWQVLTPTQLPPAEATLNQATGLWTVTNELFNPMSGFYTLVTQKQIGPKNPACPTCAPDLNFQPLNPLYSDPAPLPGTPANEYGRLSWHTLEQTEGKFDFSVIDNVIEPCPASEGHPLCLPRGAKFGFRIMAFNPQYKSNTNITTGADGYPVYSDVPSYIEKDEKGKAHGWLLPVNPTNVTQGHYFIPDWNDQFVLDRVWALLKALGQKYNSDPRIGILDIGLYGSWGEWHTGGLPDTVDYRGAAIPYAASNSYYSINTAAYKENNAVPGAYQVGSSASKNSIIWAHVKAFPSKQLVMLTDDQASLCTAMHINIGSPLIGLRRDSLGSETGWNSNFPPTNCTAEDGYDLVANRWRVAPFMTEPFGNGSSPTFPCQTFETDPSSNNFAINEQVQQFHIAGIKNGGFCTGTWSVLSSSEQLAVWKADFVAGYRYAPKEIWAKISSSNNLASLSLHTQWVNMGLTPTYNQWNVEFSLWTYKNNANGEQEEIAKFNSAIDLRKALPKTSDWLTWDDTFPLPSAVVPGPYELRMRVIDPDGYLNPMQLALQNQTSTAYYPLGLIVIPSLKLLVK